MMVAMANASPSQSACDLVAKTIGRLGPAFAERSRRLEESPAGIGENIGELKQHRLLSIGIPQELGGSGLDHAGLCDLVRRLAHHCGATALVTAMHCHQVAILSRLQASHDGPRQLLAEAARHQLMFLSSGGSDWLASSGMAQRTPGGYLINARKSFVSGAEMGDMFMTSAVSGNEVIHFAVPMSDPAISIERTWITMGMRGTGSHDVVMKDLFVPEHQVLGRRPAGQWSMINHLIAQLAFPIIYAAYLGIAEAARDRVLALAGKRAPDEHRLAQMGEIETLLHAARIAHRDMVEAAAEGEPGFASTNRVMMARSLVEREVLAVVSRAMDLAGGGAFYTVNRLEQLFRDAQAARFHPLTSSRQRLLSGALAFGLDPQFIQSGAPRPPIARAEPCPPPA
ncbi:acyl-CoA dehydrogenase family protein [Rhodoligotrophos defluvii]|uniref:acyl-CoA dehydrogenase family protein n=1 Tax=Rhodoligotrophos defluvii TaxID=2561934 RepID=UPI0010C979E2|nr:acyl-CoA dehydrogenase family protein [Rhodoligotrophos defluvii]